jgi:hypothetical protein
MKKIVVILGVVGLLSACGADGDPVQPTFSAGVGLSPSGVRVGGQMGVKLGPVPVTVGLAL